MRYIWFCALLFSLLIGATAVYASDTTDAKYYGVITITNNSTEATGVSVNITNISTASFIEQGYLNATATDGTIMKSGSDIPFMPGVNATIPWMLYVESISDYTSDAAAVYLPGVTGGKICYFPGAGGMTIADDPSMEIGDNGTMSLKAYLDLSASMVGETVIHKPGAITANITAANEVTIGRTVGLDFDGDEDYVNTTSPFQITMRSSFSWTAWIKPDDGQPAAAQTFVGSNNADTTDRINLQIGTDGKVACYYEADNIQARALTNTAKFSDGAQDWHHVAFVLDSTINGDGGSKIYFDGAVQALDAIDNGSTAGVVFANYTTAVKVFLGVYNNNGSYVSDYAGRLSDVRVYTTVLSAAQVGDIYNGDDTTTNMGSWWKLNTGTGATASDSKGTNHGTITNATWVADSNRFWDWLTASGLSSGEQLLTVTANVTSLGVYFDSVLEDTATLGLAIADTTANDWVIGSDATPYIEYYKHYVDGVLKSSIAWEYDTTFTDLSGNGNDATPTFRTTSSDADVTATLTAFVPITQPKAPAFTIGEGADYYTTNITMSGNFTTGNMTLKYPGRALIIALSEATVTPEQLPNNIIGGFLILALSFVISFFTKSTATKMFVICGAMGIAIAVHVFDWWMLVIFIMFAVAILFASNERVRA